jgi:hypothetical protein
LAIGDVGERRVPRGGVGHPQALSQPGQIGGLAVVTEVDLGRDRRVQAAEPDQAARGRPEQGCDDHEFMAAVGHGPQIITCRSGAPAYWALLLWAVATSW